MCCHGFWPRRRWGRRSGAAWRFRRRCGGARPACRLPAFQGLDGKFDRDAYKLALQQEGLSEAEFEAKIRDETARTVIQDAAVSATASPAMLDDMITGAWATETRSFTLAELLPSDRRARRRAGERRSAFRRLALYQARRATSPMCRLSPEMVVGKVTLDDAALQQAYQARIDDYVTPERRLVEKLVYPDAATATAAKARFDAGEIDFAGLARERGLELADVDLGDVGKEDLGAAGDAVLP
ncbi:MAG: peptidylprolyl isomerase [Defluviimonas denitrificans]